MREETANFEAQLEKLIQERIQSVPRTQVATTPPAARPKPSF